MNDIIYKINHLKNVQNQCSHQIEKLIMKNSKQDLAKQYVIKASTNYVWNRHMQKYILTYQYYLNPKSLQYNAPICVCTMSTKYMESECVAYEKSLCSRYPLKKSIYEPQMFTKQDIIHFMKIIPKSMKKIIKQGITPAKEILKI